MVWRKYPTFLAASVLLYTLLILGQSPFLPTWFSTYGLAALAAPADIPDPTADRVLGQLDFVSTTSDLTASTLNSPSGVAIAPDDRLFVVDYGHNRVVSWPSASAFAIGAAADLVLGQPDFTSMTGATSKVNLSAPESVAVDSAGNVWVADSYNMRVLRFSPPLSNGMAADLVIGQANFAGNEPNQGLSVPNGAGFWFPRGLDFDSQGRLYVADLYNNRVLRFAPPFSNGMSANLVIGQANFVSGQPDRDGLGAKINGLRTPAAVLLDSSDNLYVADRENNRILQFNTPLTNGMNASKVFGQPNFTSEAPWIENCIDNPENTAIPVITANSLSEPLDLAFNAVGDLVVSDLCYHRVLIYTNPAGSDTTADYVYGQADFTSGERNRGNSVPSEETLSHPLGLAISNTGALYVADFENHRVLAYDVAMVPPTATPTGLPTATSIATATPTGLPTATPTVSVTPITPAGGDSYENDDVCAQAKAIPSDGIAQMRTFHVAGDADWIRFDAVQDGRYLIEVQIPDGSPADSALEIYPSCGGALSDSQDHTFSAGCAPGNRGTDQRCAFLKAF